MILIIDSDSRKRNAISETFYYMGIISYPSSVKDAVREISPLYKAVIISSPENIPSIDDYITRLHSFCAGVPIYSLSNVKGYYNSAFYECIQDGSFYSSSLIYKINKYYRDEDENVLCNYMLAGIDASADKKYVTYLDKRIPFTKTETMILRYLILSYPTPKTPSNILKYSFKATRKPDVSSIRTHISLMNKKFSKLCNKNVIINVENQGYAVATPELLNMINSEIKSSVL